tara:strand:- start:3668 stop:6112 length:2445 start_codon:yes stop_codon:yes gene_type:complete
MNFLEQIKGITQIDVESSTNNITTAQLDQFLKEGVKDVQDRLIRGNDKAASQFTTNVTHNSSSGIPTLGGQVISVMRATTASGDLAFRPCYEINPNERFLAADRDSLAYRSKFNAGYYMLDGLIHVVPQGSGAPEDTIKVTYVDYPTPVHTDQHIGNSYAIASDVTATDTDPTVFTATSHPFMNGDIVYCTNFTQMVELNGLMLKVENTTANTFELSGINASPAETSIATDRGGTIEKLSSTFPDQYERLVVLFACMRCLESIMTEKTMPAAIDITSLTIPPVPTQPLFDSDDASLQNAVDKVFVTLSGNPPKFNINNTKLVNVGLETFSSFSSFTKLAPSIFDVPQPLAYPNIAISFDAPISTAVSWSDATINKLQQKIAALNTYTGLTYNESDYSFELEPWTFTESPDFSHISVPNFLSVQPYIADYEGLVSELPVPWNPGTDVATGKDATDNATVDYNEAVGQQLNWTAFNAALAEDDFDKATAELTKITQMVTLREGQFTKQMEVYKEKVTRLSDKLTNVTEKEWQSAMAVYQHEVAQYTLDVQNVFTKWTHDMNRESQKFTQINSNKLSKATHDMTNGLNEYNRKKALLDTDIAALNTDLQNAFNKAVKDAELEDNMEIQNAVNAAKRDLDQYQQDLKKYEVSVTRYNSDVTSALDSYKADLTKELDAWKTHMNNISGAHKDDIAQAKNIFDAENAEYQASIQKDLQEVQQNAEAAIQKMDLSTNVDLQNKAQKLQASIQKFQGDVDLYVSQFTGYKEQVAALSTVFASGSQKAETEYNWLMNTYNQLKAEYNENLGMAPQAPQEKAGA